MEDIKTIVAARPKEGVFDATAVTPAGRPNIEVKTLPTWAIVLIRAVRVYWQAFMGLMTVKMSGADQLLNIPMPAEFLAAVILCLKLAPAVALWTALQNAGELWKKIDQKYPEVRG